MDRVNSRIAQAYGYAVCFITVITMLIGIKQVVDAAFDLSDPIRAEAGGYGRTGRPLTSFELYKMEARREPQMRPAPVGVTRAAADTLSDADLRKLYDAERDQAVGNAKFRAIRSLVGNLLMIVVAAVLFFIHWRWLRERDTVTASG
ncbi:MAG TPA: hypothetical protein VLJ83_03905 [Gemmatimonadaceae bacterium]|nr:hypothetical protein [Gemmatimonadaceae bacterium]